MFNFFKKKQQFQPSQTQLSQTKVLQEEVLSKDEITTIHAQLAERKNQLSVTLEQANPNTTIIAKHYEEMGLIVAKLDKDQAIEYLENSLSYQLTIGDGYKQLMSLYNQKRVEAAQNGDGNGIDKWMNKMDEMRQIAKKVIITG